MSFRPASAVLVVSCLRVTPTAGDCADYLKSKNRNCFLKLSKRRWRIWGCLGACFKVFIYVFFFHCVLGANLQGRIPGAGSRQVCWTPIVPSRQTGSPLLLFLCIFPNEQSLRGGCCPRSLSKFSLSAGETYTYHSVARSTIVSVATAVSHVKTSHYSITPLPFVGGRVRPARMAAALP